MFINIALCIIVILLIAILTEVNKVVVTVLKSANQITQAIKDSK